MDVLHLFATAKNWWFTYEPTAKHPMPDRNLVSGLCGTVIVGGRCNAPIPLGYDPFPTRPTSADLGTYARAATIGDNVPFPYSDYAVVTLDTL